MSTNNPANEVIKPQVNTAADLLLSKNAQQTVSAANTLEVSPDYTNTSDSIGQIFLSVSFKEQLFLVFFELHIPRFWHNCKWLV